MRSLVAEKIAIAIAGNRLFSVSQKLLHDGDPHGRQVFGETTNRVFANGLRYKVTGLICRHRAAWFVYEISFRLFCA
jgi:hypothetical protein